MSKEQWKPVEKPTGNPRDLVSVIMFAITLTAILSVLLFVLDKCQVENPPDPRAYYTTKNELQNVVIAYQTDHNGSLPILSDTYTNANCSNCSVINISALLVANGGLFTSTPDGLHLSASGNDNCGGNASLGCSTDASYIWIVDADGNVFSYCAGVDCTTNNSGYQDVWP